MFELLKKKISSFTDKLKKKIEAEPQAETKKTTEQIPEEKKPEKIPREKKQVQKEGALSEEEKIWKQAEEEAQKEEELKKPAEEEKTETDFEIEKEIPAEETEIPHEAEIPEAVPKPRAFEEKKRDLKAKVGIGGKVKRFFGGEIAVEEKDLKELLEELELSLLEADVEQSAAEEIAREIQKRILGKKISSRESIDETIKREIKEILLGMMETKQIDFLKTVKEKKPFKILFLGPNGAGKTTSMAKITKFLQDNNLKVIWAASDTFRAASIEQLEKHAEKLGVRVVKHNYGADPAAVAFDAVKAAEAKGIDAVLIDSAGRQETNKNLMEELKKIVRVIKPDLKIYVGESFTGQALLQQAEEYDKAIGIDGFILTKIDCDAKGGTTISLLYKLKKPVLFVGTGQEYKDLEKFRPEFVLDKIL
ncbi:MAG TPA: signal recognition particle-docking protein FtsY [archaeon]|nr:signal recognition particle-docking protein FtsY [archaeon]